MNQEQVLAWAREAGWQTIEEQPAGLIFRLERFAALVAAHEREKEIKRVAECHGWTQAHWTAYEESIAAAEREACAKVCEEPSYMQQRAKTSTECAAAIRARGEK